MLFEKAVGPSEDEQSIPESISFESTTEPFVQAMVAIMARRVDQIQAMVTASPQILTGCLRLIVKDAPETLEWYEVQCDEVENCGCFEASNAGTLFSINLLNGNVLVDGFPPGLLPSSITSDPLFVRTFGNKNFEVVKDGLSSFRSCSPIGSGIFYRFSIDGNNQLQIFEQNSETNEDLVLLRKDEIDLPIRLREMHSHWSWNDKGIVVIRAGHEYNQRAASYIMAKEETYLVPFANQMHSANYLLLRRGTFDKFRLGQTSVSEALCRFENESFIHVIVDASNSAVKYCLPRFSLEFEQSEVSVLCTQFSGFRLLEDQTFRDTLAGLSQGLILENEFKERIVLIPHGVILPFAQIQTSDKHDAKLAYWIYKEHKRFRSLQATNTIGRLHLAALYASNASSVSDKRFGKTGFMVAIELLRQCWRNEPFSDKEASKLLEVETHSMLCSSLTLMCSYLFVCSNRLRFLHEANGNPPMSLKPQPLALEDYRLRARGWLKNSTLPRLHASEEVFFLGPSCFTRKEDTMLHTRTTEPSKFVKATDLNLESMVRKNEAAKGLFPLNDIGARNLQEVKMMAELKGSYEIYRKEPKYTVSTLEDSWSVLNQYARNTTTLRDDVEKQILDQFVPRRSEDRLLLYSGSRFILGTIDLLTLLTDPERIRHHHFPSGESTLADLIQDSLDWGLLCVLEDKLSRIKMQIKGMQQHDEADPGALIDELICTREWEPAEHLKWLAFEVEQQIQIRPYQYHTVRQLMENPGTMVQLNMGLGKTRVLVPMLVMQELDEKHLIRLSVLPAILHEAVEFYRKTLTASALCINLYTMPFHRNVGLDAETSEALTDEIQSCIKNNGFLVLAPRHRNSLLLKQYDHNVSVKGLKKYPVWDLIDESDAILHYDFQLVYALGSQVPLPDGPSRWNAIEVLLQILARSSFPVLYNAVFVHREVVSPGTFPRLRLLQDFFQSNDTKQAVASHIAAIIISEPPRHLRWINQLSVEDKQTLVEIMLFPETAGVGELISRTPLFLRASADILALRGCLAYGLLFHGLSARHRVNFGLNERSSKQLAVPFSASDTPKDRSEFSHPDMAILFTALSYLHTGLTLGQFKGTMHELLRQGPEAQANIFSEWIASIRDGVAKTELTRFDDVRKVDLSNQSQMILMHKHLGQSMGPICYWMNYSVFPLQTYQFPMKRATSAFDLVDKQSNGFSGTDDIKDVLPLAVRQQAPVLDSLRGTNGMMIDLILASTDAKLHVFDEQDTSKKLWHVVIESCKEVKADALIDVGAAMAGCGNEEAARYAAETIGSGRHRGIVFFSRKTNTWNVLEMESQRILALASSSLSEAECFVIFDESHCRGTDMKLKIKARALITFERKTTKDKFLQGCARMRRLGENMQRLVIAGTHEVVSTSSTVNTVLEMVLRNTVQLTRRALPIYIEHGRNHALFPKPIQLKLELKDLYMPEAHLERDFLDHLDAQEEIDVDADRQADYQEFICYVKEMGKNVLVEANGLGQECERELEEELEAEKQQEVEFSHKDPNVQVDWNYGAVFQTTYVTLFDQRKFVPLRKKIRQHLPAVKDIGWSPMLYCTVNFWNTIRDAAIDEDMTLYLRGVNSMLVFNDGRVVLVSLYELDHLLPLWWEHAASVSARVSVYQLSSIVRLNNKDRVSLGYENCPISAETMASIKLFSGLVKYSPQEKECLKRMLFKVKDGRHRKAVEQMLRTRHRLLHFERSDLEEVCDTLE